MPLPAFPPCPQPARSGPPLPPMMAFPRRKCERDREYLRTAAPARSEFCRFSTIPRRPQPRGASGRGQREGRSRPTAPAPPLSVGEASYQSIPGHPRWGLAPIEMAWEGKTPGEICRQIKDPARNGGRDLACCMSTWQRTIWWAGHGIPEPAGGPHPAPRSNSAPSSKPGSIQGPNAPERGPRFSGMSPSTGRP